MASVAVYNQKGEKKEMMDVMDQVFDIPMNEALIKQVYDVLRANSRSGHAHTKDRGERAGSGKKPWKQKGTGRARVGSVRTPVWRKGGVVFGPTKDRNYSGRISVSMRRCALRVVLSEKIRKNLLVVVDSLILEELKTKNIILMMNSLSLTGNIFIGLSSQEVETKRAISNISSASSKEVSDMNIIDALHSNFCVLSKEALEALQERLIK
ncbi:MAG: 50S ribosomal protein L4 [Candidatus Moraniibacteriota bacterium]|nr:MAG: 50S ribosomal protein L4 [Candidatus Moranbacteria bacterium]